MELGVAFPTTELLDPSAAIAFARGAEELGFTHLTCFEHVLGTQGGKRTGSRSYTPDLAMHEPMVLFGFLAGATKHIDLVTAVLVLPQRQTALVARQAAEIDVLSGGRLRLGVAVGWNAEEFEGMGEEFSNRGQRFEEQVALLRAFWSERAVTYEGSWHTVRGSGITLRPPGGSIPIWMGGGENERVLRRIGRTADGWMPNTRDASLASEGLRVIEAAALEAGRDPKSLGMQGRLPVQSGTPEEWHTGIRSWREAGATHLVLNTSGLGSGDPEAHLNLLRRVLDQAGAEANGA